MSIRSAKRLDTPLPILGEAVGSPVGGFWSRLLVSPPTTPPSIPTASPSISSLILAASAREPVPAVTKASKTVPSDSGVPTLIGFFPSHLYELPETGMMTFRQATETVQISDNPRRIMAKEAVIGMPVAIDAVAWSEMEAPEGSVGHVFSFSNEGRGVCKAPARSALNDPCRYL